MKYYVYVLWSDSLKQRYVGMTKDVEERLKMHNSGRSKYTKRGKPWKLIYLEEYVIKRDAIERERFLKTGVGRKWLDEKFPEYRRGAGVA
ncbi:MAG: GIY-YIG nuclease family protein [Ignavibacteria bacterium]